MIYTDYNLPTIAYIPGLSKRPDSNALKRAGVKPQSLSDSPFHQNIHFLHGVDLFNGQFFWEAHEAWEDIWHEEIDKRFREIIQGMIQFTAGMVKIKQGNDEGARQLFSKSLDRLQNAEPYEEMGLSRAISRVSYWLKEEEELTIEHLFCEFEPEASL